MSLLPHQCDIMILDETSDGSQTTFKHSIDKCNALKIECDTPKQLPECARKQSKQLAIFNISGACNKAINKMYIDDSELGMSVDDYLTKIFKDGE